MNLIVVQGDIAAQSVDALVNAAGTSLRMGSGITGALRRDNGPGLNEAAMAKGPVSLGAIAATDALDLDAEVVIHTAAMPHDGDGQATAMSIRDAVLVPVLCEGGVREHGKIDRLLGDACDAVGMTRLLYAEPEPPAQLLGRDVSTDTRVICKDCNNCAVSQATGASGVCRTPAVLARAGTLRVEGVYDTDVEAADADGVDSEG